jgi:REP element-mobilizing transposase RayT
MGLNLRGKTTQFRMPSIVDLSFASKFDGLSRVATLHCFRSGFGFPLQFAAEQTAWPSAAEQTAWPSVKKGLVMIPILREHF